MRSAAQDYSLIAPRALSDVLRLLSEEPGRYTPIAGGTELMVALNTGRLAARELVSINHLKELRFIDVHSDTITFGAGTTFSDLRRNAAVSAHLPMLAQTASWTGSIANQNRSTLGGNIVNASPAADSPPALLVYDASLRLVSAKGERTLPYSEFHLGYKKTMLQEDELVYSVSVPCRWDAYVWSVRKVGARNAQAISKVALAALADVREGYVHDLRLAAASLSDRPMRLLVAESALRGKMLNEETLRETILALRTEVRPIDDIRSTAKYRAAVAGNLLEQFLRELL